MTKPTQKWVGKLKKVSYLFSQELINHYVYVYKWIQRDITVMGVFQTLLDAHTYNLCS